MLSLSRRPEKRRRLFISFYFLDRCAAEREMNANGKKKKKNQHRCLLPPFIIALIYCSRVQMSWSRRFYFLSSEILQVPWSDKMFGGSSFQRCFVCAQKTICMWINASTPPFCLAAEVTPSVAQPVGQHELRRSKSGRGGSLMALTATIIIYFF